MKSARLTEEGRRLSLASAVHQYEDAPAEVLALVSDIAGRCGVELSSHFSGEFVAGIGVKPAPDIEPLGGFVAIPAVLVGQDQLHNIAAKLAEGLDQLGQRKPLILADPVAALDSGLIGRLPAPVGFADQHHPVRGDAAPEKL